MSSDKFVNASVRTKKEGRGCIQWVGWKGDITKYLVAAAAESPDSNSINPKLPLCSSDAIRPHCSKRDPMSFSVAWREMLYAGYLTL